MKIFCVLSYSGAAYQGFERQLDKATVQGKIEEQLSFVLGKPTCIKAAGRTDKGVNALGQTFTFHCERDIGDLQAFQNALNRLLPRDIEILETKIVPENFDARHSSCGKRYIYRFSYGQKMALMANQVAFLGIRKDFDAKRFIEALRIFEGEHNFQNFTVKKEDIDGFIRNLKIESILVDEAKRYGEVIFQGNGFMTYMIRFLMGAAIKAAFHKLSLEEIQERLDSPIRHIVSFKASPEGLTLLEVLYPHEN